MARRRGGAVAAAAERGSDVENVAAGVEELIDLAERNGPPEVPDDLGNFTPELDDQPRQTRAGRETPPERKGRPQHLPDFNDEDAIRQAEAGDADSPAETPHAPRAPQVARPAEDEGEEEVSELEELRRWRATQEAQNAERDVRLTQALGEIDRMRNGGAAPGAGAAAVPGGNERYAAIANAFRYENVLPFQVDEQALHTVLQGGPQGARALDAMLRSAVFRALQVGVEAYNADQDIKQSQSQNETHQATQEQQTREAVRDAFYTTNPDLVDYQKEVKWISREVAAQYNGQITPQQWVTLTGTAVRGYLRERGFQVAAAPVAAPAQPRAAAAPGGGSMPAFRSAAPSRPRVRPAGMDFGPGRGSVNGNRLEPVQQEIMDLARYQ